MSVTFTKSDEPRAYEIYVDDEYVGWFEWDYMVRMDGTQDRCAPRAFEMFIDEEDRCPPTRLRATNVRDAKAEVVERLANR